ncbi:Colicin V production protein [Rubripirellula amarantea]|uniref:Colicin V production protein n=2 Tax=Rubripirellula amarantea TaxID=2527999 RepID=A0A5C5WUC0_9BACT|nr:Colicin V production protein [Rubripirellula amarantea]
MRLFWCIAFFGPAGYFGYQGEPLLAAVLVAAGVGSLSGYRMGALSMITSVAAFAAAVWYGPSLGIEQEARFTQWFGTTGLLNRGVSIGVVAIAISMVVWFISYLTIGRVIARRPSLDRLNRRSGFLLGCVQSSFAVVLLIGGILMIEPVQRERVANQNIPEADLPRVTKAVFWISEEVDQSAAGKYMREYNPFTRIPQLNQIERVQQTAAVLADPSKMNEVIEHPSIRQLQNRPDVREAVAELRGDENLREILTSGKPMDRAAAMTLLSHPAVLNLVDQPGFLDEAKKAIADAGL